ncbi:XdhC Rossmann domain-containing protein [Amycolatopsis xylanica]|uniref:XdhC Rossmann domain-containing protein n=1 Tax=Amycolatopsis xylanica TaxID=589385 RepID=A0A1H2SRP7_9PSEU|nr:XdhC family protein [Amycolatopsis xylanica]SDW34292.1 XdhC Rossmann domain-containing protein [Amycolatopsis xylanica]
MAAPDSSCEVAHGNAAPKTAERTLVAVFASPVARFLLTYARDLGYRPMLFEPDPMRELPTGVKVFFSAPDVDANADIVVTDHHRPELGSVLRDVLAGPSRWIGVLGNPRHPGPHVDALTALGVPAADIARVHRPVGLNIGSRTPAEIAIATLAGLIADRNARPGGFTF